MATGRKLKAGEFDPQRNYTMDVVEKKGQLRKVFKDALAPPERPTLDVWSDQHRVLPKETSSEPGTWRTNRFPFLRKVMHALSPDSVASEICVMKGAQLGFTELCINWSLYIADVCPGPTMYVQKTKDAAEDFSAQKLEPNIALCKKVENTLGTGKPKSLSNEALNKGFPGGFLVLGGANSGAFLRSKSIAYAMADEEDSFKASIDGEGSPVGMIRKRQANFPFSKFFRLSTPKYKETSTIETGYDQGSQEQYYVPCPCCNEKAHKGGTYWTIKWDNIKYSKELDDSNLPVDIHLVCEVCGGVIYEHHKTWMLDNGRWLSEKGSPGQPYEVGDIEKPSFQINSLYSPLGFFSWRDAVAEWFEYLHKKDPALLQVFINQTLGETYSVAGRDVSSGWLYERREKYLAKVPLGVLCITAGVDVQADRLEMEIVGHGLNGESWSIDYAVLWGNPKFLTHPDGHKSVWDLLDEYIMADYEDELGRKHKIDCTAIDAQYNTETVNKYCRIREHLRVFPIHGQEGWGRGYLKRPKRRHEEYHTWNYTFYVDELKAKTYGHLKVDKPGPGYCHFPEYDHYNEQHFKQMTAETQEVQHTGNQPRIKWVLPSGARNEQLDCRNYATGAFLILMPNMEARAQDLHETMHASAPAAVGSENDSTLGAITQQINNNPRQLRTVGQPIQKKTKKRKPKKNNNGVW